jgi:hypothetical protein
MALDPGGWRELGAVHSSHPAYANGHIVVRNDREIVRASLLAQSDGDSDSPSSSRARPSARVMPDARP